MLLYSLIALTWALSQLFQIVSRWTHCNFSSPGSSIEKKNAFKFMLPCSMQICFERKTDHLWEVEVVECIVDISKEGSCSWFQTPALAHHVVDGLGAVWWALKSHPIQKVGIDFVGFYLSIWRASQGDYLPHQDPKCPAVVRRIGIFTHISTMHTSTFYVLHAHIKVGKRPQPGVQLERS